MQEFEQKKTGVAADLTSDMQKQMASAKTDAEREKIMLAYANNLQKLTDALEKQKQQQLNTLRQELLDRRRQRKKVITFTHQGDIRRVRPDAK